MPVGHPAHGVWAMPVGATSPSLWILGSSNYGAQLAAHLGLPYAFAYFFSDGVGVEQALEMYRSQFRPSPFLDKPSRRYVSQPLRLTRKKTLGTNSKVAPGGAWTATEGASGPCFRPRTQ